MIPGWWQGLILALAAFRITRLIGWDHFPPIVRFRAWVTGEHIVSTGSFNTRHGLTNETPESEYAYRWPTLAFGLHCAYCTGWWVGLLTYVAWRLEPSWTLTGAFVLALSTVIGTWARMLDP